MFHGNGKAPRTRCRVFNPVERVMSRPLATARRVGTTTPVRSTVGSMEVDQTNEPKQPAVRAFCVPEPVFEKRLFFRPSVPRRTSLRFEKSAPLPPRYG
jgi:hypothetical protein